MWCLGRLMRRFHHSYHTKGVVLLVQMYESMLKPMTMASDCESSYRIQLLTTQGEECDILDKITAFEMPRGSHELVGPLPY